MGQLMTIGLLTLNALIFICLLPLEADGYESSWNQLDACIKSLEKHLAPYKDPLEIQLFKYEISTRFGPDVYEWRELDKVQKAIMRQQYPMRPCEKLIMETDEMIASLFNRSKCVKLLKANVRVALEAINGVGNLGAIFRSKMACFIFG